MRHLVTLGALTVISAIWIAGCDNSEPGRLAKPAGGPTGGASEDAPIEWDEDEWTPQGAWNSEGDTGGGDSGYKGAPWKCLICDERYDPVGAESTRGVLSTAPRTTTNGPPTPTPLPEEDPAVYYLSADDSNSESAPAIARNMILSNQLVRGDLIRLWEFLNYYDISYPPPATKALAVTPQLRPYDLDEGIFALQIGLQGRQLVDARRPLNVALSVDTSGSMSGAPIAVAKETLRTIAAKLEEEDVVSLVNWSTGQTVLLDGHAVSGPDDPALLSAIEGLAAGGTTDLHSGLAAAYSLAQANMIEDAMNRVVLISDGGANVGIVDAGLIGEAAAGAEGEAIFLVGVGVGEPGTACGYNDYLMDKVTDLGKGASMFIDSDDEAHEMFENRFLQSVEMVAHDVMVELTLPPDFEMYEYLGEEYSEAPDEVEPQHLAPNDAMVYQQLIRSTEPDDIAGSYEIGIHVTWTDGLTSSPGEFTGSWTLQELLDAPCDQLRKGDTILVYGQTLGRIWQHVVDDEHDAAVVECEWGLSVVQESAEVLDDDDLFDIAALLEHYCTNVID